jgi:hypothetical protein
MDASPFCRGETGDRGWRASFDFLLKPDTATKVLEGKYDDADAIKTAAAIARIRAEQARRA